MKAINKKSSTYLQISIILFSCYISGCSTQMQASPVAKEAPKLTTLETIYSAHINQNSIQYTVKSTGCTSKDSFKQVIKNTENSRANVSLIRTKRDLCRAMPKLIAVEFAINSDLYNTDNLTIKNPVGVSNFSRKKKQ